MTKTKSTVTSGLYKEDEETKARTSEHHWGGERLTGFLNSQSNFNLISQSRLKANAVLYSEKEFNESLKNIQTIFDNFGEDRDLLKQKLT